MSEQASRANLEAAAVRPEDFLDLQRKALQEVLNLSAEVMGPRVAEVEERLRRETAEADAALRTRLAEIESRAQSGLADAKRTYAEQRAAVESEYQSAVDSQSSKTRLAIDRLRSNTRAYEAGLQHQMQDQFLLADTVAQATCDRLRKERGAAERQIEADLKKIENLKLNAEWVLESHHIPVPPEPQLADAGRTPDDDDAASPHERCMSDAVKRLEALEHLAERGRLAIGRLSTTGVIVGLLIAAGLIALTVLKVHGAPPLIVSLPIAVVATTAVALLARWTLIRRHRVRLLASYAPLAVDLAAARRAFDEYAARTRKLHARKEARAAEVRRNNPEKAAIKQKFAALAADARRQEAESLAELDSSARRQQTEADQRREAGLAAADAQFRERTDSLRDAAQRESAAARSEHQSRVAAAKQKHSDDRAALDADWNAGRQKIDRLVEAAERIRPDPQTPWQPRPAAADDFAALVPFGRWRLQLPTRSGAGLPPDGSDPADSRGSSPAALAVPGNCSLLLQTSRAGRQHAVDTLRVIMLRLLTTLQPGRVRFTILDPLGLGESFAGFMHLADYEEALVGGRIWTDAEHIEARLTELTTHMENVIQKYLRNEFASIDAYNRQAGQLAEPYRFLVIADFPTNFNDNAIRRINSIISSGPRCGVFTLMVHDTRLKLPPELPLEDLASGRLHLVSRDDSFIAEDPLLRRFPLELDMPPPEDELTRLMHDVGSRAKNAFHVELPFDSIVPQVSERWSRSAADDLTIPIGHAGAVRLQHFCLGRGLAQHALIAGKTGSGKSTLLHVIVTNLALWYSPEEVELYLIDFKKGVEFKTYVTHALPHARAIAIESDREFGVSVLQRLDAEMTRRGDLFRAAGVQDIAAYREAAQQRLPRTVLIVDEFQVFFAEDDRLSQEAAVLLDRLVRQGRAFGIHVVLGSQTLAGTAGLARSTMGQMAVRIALQCSEADSQLILDDTNVAARLLARPGEAIYNDAGGLVAGNSNFQVAWLSDEGQAAHLDAIQSLARQSDWNGEPPIVFEGNALADIRLNRPLAALIESPAWPQPALAPKVWLGDPVAIKDPTHLALRRQSGAHALLIGQRDDVAHSLLAAAALCLAAQHAPQTASFIVFPGADEPTAGELQAVTALLPHATRRVEWREVPAAIAELAAETKRRLENGPADAPAIYIIIDGLQRYRALRRNEDNFSISESDAPPATDRQFAELLREGPPLGIHVIAWADTYATLERTLERQSIREFDNRILFQMSATDSSNLIDSPEANRLGFHRAFFFSEERGLLEKFRPYAPLDPGWLKQVHQSFNRKPS